jgi:hypothetical protein
VRIPARSSGRSVGTGTGASADMAVVVVVGGEIFCSFGFSPLGLAGVRDSGTVRVVGDLRCGCGSDGRMGCDCEWEYIQVGSFSDASGLAPPLGSRIRASR